MRKLAVALALALVLALVAGACSLPSPEGLPPPAAPEGTPIVYVAVGASETVGFGSDEPLRDSWPRVLFRTALPPSAVFVNMGIPGATVARALRDELPQARTVRPALATVWLNVNDLVSGVAPQDFERDLTTLVRELRGGGATRVLVANVPPLDALPAYLDCRAGRNRCGPESDLPTPEVLNQAVDDYNAATARVAEREGAQVVDLHALGLAARQDGTSASLVSNDGFHPSTAGHEAVARAFADALDQRGPLVPNG
ncbi:MAG: SGNH/GDSL hydrolase family protein [Acidimicrobiales bacterium]